MHAAGLAWGWTILSLGVFGLPLAVPPKPESPLMAKIAPADCLFYMNIAGTAAPDTGHDNQTEQLLAEPDVQKLADEFGRLTTAAWVKSMKDRDIQEPYGSEEFITLLKKLLGRPSAIFLSGVEKGADGAVLHGGAVVQVGADGEMKTALEAGIGRLGLPDDDGVEIAGQTWRRCKASPRMTIVWGFRGQYFLVASGEEDMKAMLTRAKGVPPDWMAALRQDYPIERFSTVAYVNVKAVRLTIAAVAGPQAAASLDGLGFGNVTTIRAATGLDQECFVSRMFVAIDGQPRGLFQLARAQPLTADDFAAVPRNANYAMAAKLDISAVFDAVVSALEKSDPLVQVQTVGAMAAMEKGLGIKFREDVLQSFGDTWLLYDAPGAGLSPLMGMAVNRLKNPDKFAAAYHKLMDVAEQGVRAASSGNEHAPKLVKKPGPGGDIYSLAFGDGSPMRPSICMMGREILLALSPEAIASRQPPSSVQDSLAASPGVVAALNVRPEPIFLSYINVPGLFDRLYPGLPEMMPKMVEWLLGEGIEFDAGALPPPEAIKKHLLPDIAVVRPTASGIMLSERTALPGIGVSSAPWRSSGRCSQAAISCNTIHRPAK